MAVLQWSLADEDAAFLKSEAHKAEMSLSAYLRQRLAVSTPPTKPKAVDQDAAAARRQAAIHQTVWQQRQARKAPSTDPPTPEELEIAERWLNLSPAESCYMDITDLMPGVSKQRLAALKRVEGLCAYEAICTLEGLTPDSAILAAHRAKHEELRNVTPRKK